MEEFEVVGAEPTLLYRLYDGSGVLLYIGLTRQGFATRMHQHAEKQSWWPEVTRKTVAWCPNRPKARIAEAQAIKDEQPKYNKREGGAAAWLPVSKRRRMRITGRNGFRVEYL